MQWNLINTCHVSHSHIVTYHISHHISHTSTGYRIMRFNLCIWYDMIRFIMYCWTADKCNIISGHCSHHTKYDINDIWYQCQCHVNDIMISLTSDWRDFWVSVDSHSDQGQLYCLSRLLQGSSLRMSVTRAMQSELEKRYRYHRVFAIPSRRANGSRFRNALTDLLLGNWVTSLDSSNADQTPFQIQIRKLLQHFNGDITQSDEWEHWCNGCCASREDGLQKAWDNSWKSLTCYLTDLTSYYSDSQLSVVNNMFGSQIRSSQESKPKPLSIRSHKFSSSHTSHTHTDIVTQSHSQSHGP